MESSVAERPIAKFEDEGHGDLILSPEERAGEVAEAAANRERDLGAVEGAVKDAYNRAYAEALEAAQQEAAPAPEAEAEGAQAELEESPAEPEDASLPPETLAVAGTSGKSRKWSGKAPGMTVLVVKVPKIEVPEGDFRKGERFYFRGEATILSEGVKDKLDKDTKQVTEAVQEHNAFVLDFELTDEPAA